MIRYINVYADGAKGAAHASDAAAVAASRLHAKHGRATLYRLRVKLHPGCYMTGLGVAYRGHL